MTPESLESAWNSMVAAKASDQNTQVFLDFFEDEALFFFEDIPFLLTKAELENHLAFHADKWRSMDWKVWEADINCFGSTGIVAATLTVRGRPVDSGFRQRHSVATLVAHWSEAAGGWRGAKLHVSTLLTHIHKSSPS